jgi:hypothetical protein
MASRELYEASKLLYVLMFEGTQDGEISKESGRTNHKFPSSSISSLLVAQHVHQYLFVTSAGRVKR